MNKVSEHPFWHIFFCTNQKNNKKCCAQANALEALEKARLIGKKLNFNKQSIKITSSGCLGRCMEGPCVLVYPQGTWFTYKNHDDIERVITYISQNMNSESKKIVEDLLLP